jgi:hypothetical protein
VSRKGVMLAGLELRQQILDTLLDFTELGDERLPVHYRVISRFGLTRRTLCGEFLIDWNHEGMSKIGFSSETEPPSGHSCASDRPSSVFFRFDVSSSKGPKAR